LKGSEFRTFAHPPAAMLAVLEDHGLRRTFAHDGLVWRVTGLTRQRHGRGDAGSSSSISEL